MRIIITLSLFLILSFQVLFADDLVLSTSMTITNDTTFENVTIQAGGILTADAIIVVTNNMTIDSGGIVTHTDRYLAGLELNVLGTLEIQSGGSINVDSRGLNGGGNGSIFGDSAETFDTSGAIVAGSWPIDNYAAGGSYGGYGAYGSSFDQVNRSYGLLESPIYLGSGGSKHGNHAGSDGGGRITIISSSLVVDGEISADGGALPNIINYSAGCGSGGSILIETDSLSGSGMIGANGGLAPRSSQWTGGGGRVAVYYNSLNLPYDNITAYGGPNGYGASYCGGAGTVYFKDSSDTQGEVIICNNSSSFFRHQSGSHLLTEESSFHRVLIRNGGWLRNDSAIVTDSLWVEQGTFDVVSDYDMGSTPLLMTIDGEVVIRDSSLMTISQFDENWIADGIIHIESGSRLDVVSDAIVVNDGVTLIKDGVFGASDVIGNMTIDSGGIVTHTDRYLAGLELNVLGTLEIQSGGSINVDSRGLNGGGNGSIFGDSAETFDTSGAIVAGSWPIDNYAAGGSYGGYGAYGSSFDQVNRSYGLLESPIYLGSGGSKHGNHAGSDGGGRITIISSSLVVDGEISADGGALPNIINYSAGCGSGGSILIETDSLSGSGMIGANGGLAPRSSQWTGGGGRVAVYYNSLNLPYDNITAYGGSNGYGASYCGGAGTVYLKDSSDTQGEVIICNDGISTNCTTPIMSNIAYNQNINIGGNGKALFDSGYTHSSGIINTASDGYIIITDTLSLDGSILGGFGSISGNILNKSEVYPGIDNTEYSSLDLDGSYTQHSGGVLSINVGGLNPGIDCDHLQVNNNAVINGNLNIIPNNGFEFNIGDSVRILSSNTTEGSIDSVQFQDDTLYASVDSLGIILFSPYSHDVKSLVILEPHGIFYPDDIVQPKAVVKNIGRNEEYCSVTISFGDDYSETVNMNLTPLQSDTIEFTPYTLSEPAIYYIKCNVELASDEAKHNNIIGHHFSVRSSTGPEIHSIQPIAAATGVIRDVSIIGERFEENMSAKLMLDGETDIVANSVSVSATLDTIFASFDLTGAVIDKWDLEIRNSEMESYRFYKGFNVVLYEGEYLPFCEWYDFNVHDGSTIEIGGALSSGDNDDIFMMLKKTNLQAHNTWMADVKLVDEQGNELISESGGSDIAFQVDNPPSGLVRLMIEAYDPGTGTVKFCDQLPQVSLDEWYVGDILRPFGFDWIQFDAPEGVSNLNLRAEGIGSWNHFDVYYENINNPTEKWHFGSGVSVSGQIENPSPGRYYLRYLDTQHIDGAPSQERQYMLFIGADMEPPDPGLPPTITGLSTYIGGQGPVTVIVSGHGLDSASTVKLIRDGYEDIVADPVYGDSIGVELSAFFDLTSAETGDWQLIVTNSIGISDTCFDNYYIENVSDPDVSIEIIGRNEIRLNRWSNILIRCHSSGNVDILNPLVWIEFSEHMEFKTDMQLAFPISDTLKSSFLVFFPNKIYPGESQSFEFQVFTSSYENIIECGMMINKEIYTGRLRNGKNSKVNYHPGQIISEWHRETLIESTYDDFWHIKCGIYYVDEMQNAFVIGINENNPLDYPTSLVISMTPFDDWVSNEEWSIKLNCSPPCLDEQMGIDIAEEAFRRYEEFVENGTELTYEFLPISTSRYNSFTWIKEIYDMYGCHFDAYPWTPIGVLLGQWGCYHHYSMPRPTPETGECCENDIIFPPVESWIPPIPENDSLHWDEISEELRNLTTVVAVLYVLGMESIDPEEKYGPNGFDFNSTPQDSLSRYLSDSRESYSYRIDFWNHEEATADAQLVMIRDTLDSDFDIGTFQFDGFGFLDKSVDLEGGQYFDLDIDMRPEKDIIVNVEGTFDPDHRAIEWIFTSLVPKSDTLPDLIGFLPPMSDSGYEIAWVDFSVDPLPDLPTGTKLTNQCYSNFDWQPPCDTCPLWTPAPKNGPWTNTIDVGPPRSWVTPLPDTTYDLEIMVDWSGLDDDSLELGSGIKNYDIYYSDNGGAFNIWLEDTTATSAEYTGCVHGHTYSFYSIAEDNVGHIELPPDSFDAKTTISYYFVCGDADSTGAVNILDITYLINYLYKGGPEPKPLESGDVNFNGEYLGINLLDITYLINYLYKEGPELDCTGLKKSSPGSPVRDSATVVCEIKEGNSVISIKTPVELMGIELITRSLDSPHITFESDLRGFNLYYSQTEDTIKLGMLDIRGENVISIGRNTIIKATGEIEIISALGADLSSMPVPIKSSNILLPREFDLSQNYPNPFNPTTVINFALPRASNVELNIFNILGQKVITLINENMEAGYHSVKWDGVNSQCQEVATGVYFYRMSAGDFVKSKKMLLLK